MKGCRVGLTRLLCCVDRCAGHLARDRDAWPLAKSSFRAARRARAGPRPPTREREHVASRPRAVADRALDLTSCPGIPCTAGTSAAAYRLRRGAARVMHVTELAARRGSPRDRRWYRQRRGRLDPRSARLRAQARDACWAPRRSGSTMPLAARSPTTRRRRTTCRRSTPRRWTATRSSPPTRPRAASRSSSSARRARARPRASACVPAPRCASRPARPSPRARPRSCRRRRPPTTTARRSSSRAPCARACTCVPRARTSSPASSSSTPARCSARPSSACSRR